MEHRNFPLLMKSIATATTLATALLVLAYHYLHHGWLLSCAITFGTTAYHFVMRLIVGYLVPRLTSYAFDYRKPWFQTMPWEESLYQRLKLKRWKHKLPTYSPEQFSLRNHTLYQVIQNMCGAEIVHEIIMVLSFLPLLSVPVFGAFPVFLTTSILAALFDGIFVMAQRFNRPRLIRIYEKQEAKRP